MAVLFVEKVRWAMISTFYAHPAREEKGSGLTHTVRCENNFF